jgi:hypothetical protein
VNVEKENLIGVDIYFYMKYIISKSQYRRVLLKYLNSFIGNFDVEEIISKGQVRRDVRTSDGEDFGAVWHKGPATKGCKKELSIGWEYMDDLESVIPVKRKKVFSDVVLEYFYLKTGIKCDCIEFDYHTGGYDHEGYKKTFKYQYKTPKKR